MLSVAPPVTVPMLARDGCRLDATVWRPEAPGRYPVLLMRQPYGRAIASTLVFAHPAWFAANGYIVAVQDVRGTGTSEGDFRLFLDEEADGALAVAWAAALDESSGVVGTYGFSYQANTQYLALAGGARIGAMVPAMGGWDVRTDWAWENDAFRLGPNLGWALQMGFIKASHDGDPEAAHALRAASRSLPLAEPHRTRPDIIRRLGRWTHYEAWLNHPGPGAFWDRFSPAARLADHSLDVPMLHVGGWYDQMLTGTLAGHEAMTAAANAEQALWIGPWTHQPWGRHAGGADLGPAAVSPIDRAMVAWFDRHLKGHEGESHEGESQRDGQGGLRLFDLGRRTWHRFAAWPEVQPRSFWLGGDGRAGSGSAGTLIAGSFRGEPLSDGPDETGRREADRIGTEPDGSGSGGSGSGGSGSGGAGPSTAGLADIGPGGAGVDWIVHDPWRPAPVMGGHGSPPAGMRDRSELDDRADVAVYDSGVLPRPLFLCGKVSAVLVLEADQPSFDIDAVLSMVDPDGRAWTLTQGHARLDQPDGPVAVPMRAVCVTVPAGHALRLSLAGAAMPSYAVNPGSGAAAADFMAADERVITIAIRHRGSRLILPEVT